MKLSIQAGATSQTINVWIQDSSSTTGAALTGLAYNSSGLVAYYGLPRAAAVSITLATQTVTGAYSSGGFVEIDATNMPGWYRLDLPNAAIASGRFSSIHLKGATNMAPLPIEIELTAWNNQDAVRGGMTALPNANAEAAGGLYTRGSGAGQINQPANGQIDANTVKISGTAQTARDLGASVLLSTGTGTGQLDFTSGVVKANLAQILGTALTETAGQLAGAFKQFFNISSPTSTMNVITTVTTATTTTNLTNAPTSGDLTATMKTSVTTAATAATPTAAAVTGAVGSVTARVTANTDQFAGQTITAAAGVTLPASVASPTNITAGTITTVTNLTNAPTVGDFTSTMKTSLNAATPAVTVSDKTGFSLSSGGIQAIWDALTSALTTVNSIGKLLVTNIDALISSRTKPADTQAAVTLVTTTTNLTNAPTSGDLTATMKTSVTTAATAATPTATVSGDFSATMKTSLNAATPASVVGAVGSVTGNVGGNVVGSVGSVTGLTASNLDTTVSSRLATSGYTTPPTANANADALLGRNLAGGSNGGRTVQDALRPSRNKVVINSGTITVYAEDDTTIAWTGVLTTDATADPITAMDPA